MNEAEFADAFAALTRNRPFPWQGQLYRRFSEGDFPSSCSLPTGLGKTAVIPIWLLALAYNPDRVPRRLVYVVNRRTVVDRATDEARKMRDRLSRVPGLSDRLRTLCALTGPTSVPLAISTFRGPFADDRQWCSDPTRPALIAGTVDMIGSRLLFSGYRCGFKRRPLEAGLLGQDALLVHDEAHLEPAFQDLVVGIQREQHERERTGKLPWPKLQVMELTAISHRARTVFSLSDADRADAELRKRLEAKKAIHLHENREEKKLAEQIAGLALQHKGSGRAVVVYVRTIDDVDKVVKQLPKNRCEQLTGTLRGKEQDELVKQPRFQRFLPESDRDKDVTPAMGTVYLVATSAGEVGVNLSADHLVCDLSTFDRMALRLGRVNRFGDCDDTRIDIVHPKEFADNPLDLRRKKTLELLRQSGGNASPAALGELHHKAIQHCSGAGPMSTDRSEALRESILATYAPQPRVLPVSDILFDAWALTTVREKLPGRPMVEPYLHGTSEWEPPQTQLGWREEVDIITGRLLRQFRPEDLLEDYPLKPHELLRDNSSRVFDRLGRLGSGRKTPVWIVAGDDTIVVTTLARLIDAGKEPIESKTILLPPKAGGLENGRFTGESSHASDVADQHFDENGNRRRVRVWEGDADYQTKTQNMRLVRRIDLLQGEDEDEDGDEYARSWHWFESPVDADTDGSTSSHKPVRWQVHTDDVTENMARCAAQLRLPEELTDALVLAAKWHDLGKRRKRFQTILGNFKYPEHILAKAGKKRTRIPESYRHELGSLVDVLDPGQPFLAEFRKRSSEMQDVVLHLIAAQHGYGRPHFPGDLAFDPEPKGQQAEEIAVAVARRFARMQRRFGRWGLAYLESLLRAADRAAGARPSRVVEDER